jgi:hypothetical protein
MGAAEPVVETRQRVQRVRLLGQEVLAVVRALQVTRGACTEASARCTDIYLDRGDGEYAQRAARLNGAGTRVVLRELPEQEAAQLAVEVEQQGELAARSVAVARAERRPVLGPATAAELFPFLPPGVGPALAVRSVRRLLVHPEGWTVRLDEGIQAWRTSAAGLLSARNEPLPAGHSLPGALLEVRGEGPGLPAWLRHLLAHGNPWPDVFVLAASSRVPQLEGGAQAAAPAAP